MPGDKDFVDVTLGTEGKKLPAHKMLLSACSPYFRELLKVENSFSLASVQNKPSAVNSTRLSLTVPKTQSKELQ
jgi:hypothetical protein